MEFQDGLTDRWFGSAQPVQTTEEMLAMRNTTSQPLVQRRLTGTTRETRSSADEQRIQALMRQEKQKTIDEAVAAASTKDVGAKWGSG
jgi:hypothetical protein